MQRKWKVTLNAYRDLHTRGLITSDIDFYWDAMTEVQQDYVGLRYDRMKSRTFAQIADTLKVNKETVRRGVKAGLRRIKDARDEDNARNAAINGTATSGWSLPRPVFKPNYKTLAEIEHERRIWDSARRVDPIATLLYQSGIPNEERLSKHNIGLVIDVSAQKKEWDNPERAYVACPLSDTDYIPNVGTLYQLADLAREGVSKGVPTMIHCQMGWNRSGLVMGVTLWLMTGKAGTEVVNQIRGARPEALGNMTFRGFIEALPAVEKALTPEEAKAILRHYSSPEKVREYTRLGQIRWSTFA